MDVSKEEVQSSLLHRQKIVQILRQRLQQRELQEATQGINTPPEVLTEIHDLNERISQHEKEIERLQRVIVEDKLPLAEVEYRAALARSWQSGRLSTLDSTYLELERLQLGIPVERAQLLEEEIRASLAIDMLQDKDADDIVLSIREQLSNRDYSQDSPDLHKGVCQGIYAQLSQLSRAIDLNSKVVVNWITKSEVLLNIEEIDAVILIAGQYSYPGSGCKLKYFKAFLHLLKNALASESAA